MSVWRRFHDHGYPSLITTNVVMPDHLHVVLSVTPGKPLGRIVQLIKGRFAWRYNRAACVTGKFWQGRYHEKALLSDQELFAAIEYVYYNPVEAGLVSEPGDYPWSSVAPPPRVSLRG